MELARLLIKEGKLDATGRGDAPGYTPLCTAAREGSVALLRMLVVEGGADLWQVVGVEMESGRPFLRLGMDTL